MSESTELAADLQRTADEMAEVIADFKRSCEPGASAQWGPDGIDPLKVRNSAGGYVLMDMLAARGQVLAALAALA